MFTWALINSGKSFETNFSASTDVLELKPLRNSYALSVRVLPELTTSSISSWLAGSIIVDNSLSSSSLLRFFLNPIPMVCGSLFSLSFECFTWTDLFQTATSGVSVISSISFEILPYFVISTTLLLSFALAELCCFTSRSWLSSFWIIESALFFPSISLLLILDTSN